MSDNNNLSLRTSELARKYLERTSAEVDELRQLIAQVPRGDEHTYRNIEILVHRIRGSGALFGFELISDAALGIESLAIDAKIGLHPDRHAVQTRLAALARVLGFVVETALADIQV
jgi:HPt (histidine-containing phosphotransfer) domain-containing protein